MRKFILVSVLAVFVYVANAGIITVSNDPNSPGQYSSLQDAINAANNGDTLLVAGSLETYGDITIQNKEVHIIGVGYRPDKQSPKHSEINTIIFNGTPNGSSLEGFEVTGYVHNNGADFVTLKRNRINLIKINSESHDIYIYNNIIGELTKDYYQNDEISNLYISNNIITNKIKWGDPNALPNTNIFVSNNLFVGCGNAFEKIADNFYHFTCVNNIFYASSPYHSNMQYCDFSNNLSYNTTNDNFNTSGTNTGSNNVVSQNPDFVSETNDVFDYTDDYNLNAGSPAIGAGNDGNDIGIYGGTYPWPEGGISGSGYMYSQEPQVPQVHSLILGVPVNNSLNVQVQGVINN